MTPKSERVTAGFPIGARVRLSDEGQRADPKRAAWEGEVEHITKKGLVSVAWDRAKLALEYHADMLEVTSTPPTIERLADLLRIAVDEHDALAGKSELPHWSAEARALLARLKPEGEQHG